MAGNLRSIEGGRSDSDDLSPSPAARSKALELLQTLRDLEEGKPVSVDVIRYIIDVAIKLDKANAISLTPEEIKIAQETHVICKDMRRKLINFWTLFEKAGQDSSGSGVSLNE